MVENRRVFMLRILININELRNKLIICEFFFFIL